MDRPIFNLVYSSWDYEETYFFYGPENSTQEQFQDLCEALIPQAGQLAVERQKHEEYETWVTWTDVVESLIPLLERQGYQRFDLPKFTVVGSGIIGMSGSRKRYSEGQLGYSAKLISEYNRVLDEKFKKDTDTKPNKSLTKRYLPQIMK